MLVKAIIEERIDKYSYKIRIPLINKLSSSANPTSNEHLSVAPICTIPGIEIIYNKGDVVFVDFEKDDLSEPVIIGSLFRKTNSGSYTTIHTSTLDVDLTTKLPTQTIIGYSSADDVNNILASSDAINSLIESGGGGGSVEEATSSDVDTAKQIFS